MDRARLRVSDFEASGWLRGDAQAALRSLVRPVCLLLAGILIFGAEAIGADYGAQLSQTPKATDRQPRAASIAPPAAALATLPPTAVAEPLAASPKPATADVPEPAAAPGMARLPGHVLPALALASRLAPERSRDDKQLLTLTLTLKRDDEEGFQGYLRDVYDAQSPQYRKFLSPAQVASRFGPSRGSYRIVVDDLRRQGFKTVRLSKNRLTLTVRGRRRVAERAFALHIANYQLNGQSFYANDIDPALPIAAFAHVQAISGLSNLAAPRPTLQYFPANPAGQALWYALCMNAAISGGSSALTGGLGIFFPAIIPELTVIALFLFLVPTPLPPPFGNTTAGSLFPQYFKCANQYNRAKGYSLIPGYDPPAPAWQGVDGTGQTIGLVEFDNYLQSDVANYISLMGLPATAINKVSSVPVAGGVAPGAAQDEVLLDIGDVLTAAPGAKIKVYDAPFTGPGTSFQAVFNAMINGGVNIISNSWAYCEDQTTLADVQSIDTILQAASASGISVLSGSGDSGSTCLDGAANTASVPADSPHITAVGGTSMTLGAGFTYGSETWWDGSAATVPTGQGGFGVSKFFARPAYQNGLNAAGMRSIPDVASDADPAHGVFICQASAGGCPTGSLYGGTSSSTPSWAAYAALLNQAQGSNLGFLNPLIYPFANTPAFHNAASMQTDFSHVGLGSPNLSRLHQALTKQTTGAVSTSVSLVSAYLPNTYTLPHELAGSLPLPDFADGTSPAYIVVNLADANGNTLSGKSVTLAAGSGSHAVITPQTVTTSADGGTAVFTVTDLTSEIVTFTATDATDSVVLAQSPQVAFVVPLATSAGVSANPGSVAVASQVPPTPPATQPSATVIVTLKDSLNRPTPGKTVTIIASGSHTVVTGPTPSVTDANGQIEFSATDQVAETVTFTAVDVTDGNLPVPGSATVTYSGTPGTDCGIGVAAVAGTGYTITPFITGLPAASTLFYGGANIGCPGGSGLVFTSAGTALATDFLTGGIYQTGASGGALSSGNLLNTLTPALGNLVYGKDGSLYASLGDEGAQIVQLNPATGTIARVVASGLTCPAGLAIDPLSGDLFFDDECTNGGTDNPSIFRIIDPANSDPNNPTSVVTYATLPTTPNGGMAFAPNGALYAVSGYYYTSTAQVEQISGTNATTVTVSPVTGITSDYTVAIGATNADGSAQSLIVEPSGTLTEIPIATPSAGVVLATGSPGVGVTGPDGCLYSAHYDTIYRLANASGNCTFAPTSPAPSIKLTPGTVAPNPAQGGTQTFTATIHNVSPLAGVPVIFKVNGANKAIKLVDTDANGNAALTYASVVSGTDNVIAATTAGGAILTSNQAQVTWTAGKHLTLLTMNASPQGATVNQQVTVTASLTDLSSNPVAAVPGQSVTFTLGGSSCMATTNAAGTASCALTPSQSGSGSLSASFAGNGQFTSATHSIGFTVSAPPTPAPTLTITASPVTIAVGSAATLSWSSSNATACAASGAWGGAQATSGTLAVTPTTSGSYSYTLTCTGAGGSAAATALLSATLVAVTVTAKSGGGAIGWYVLLFLAVLVMVRYLTSPLRPKRMPGWAGITLVSALLGLATVDSARADSGAETSQAASTATDPYYVGIRVGGMPVRQDAGHIDQGLADRGFGDVTASSDTSGTAGTLFVGYEFTPHTAVELGYTFREATAAHLSGTIPSTAGLTPLLQNTTELIRGYGNIVSLSYAGRFEVLPRFSLEPRLGGFFWATKVSAISLDDRIDTTHEGGGVTAGVTAAYRVWRGLEFGVSIDHYRGFPSNIATLYAGTLVWRFGR